MPTYPLPFPPDLGQLRNRARDLQKAVRAGRPEAVALVHELHPRAGEITPGDLAALPLADAQLVVARSYRFAPWPALRRHLDVVRRYTRVPHLLEEDGPVSPAGELVRLGA